MNALEDNSEPKLNGYMDGIRAVRLYPQSFPRDRLLDYLASVR